MARADLHYAMVIDAEIWQASRIDAGLMDPVVRVPALPGRARQVLVIRDYQGPQGTYVESCSISDRGGNRVWASEPRQIRLRGEMFEDRFTTAVTQLDLEHGDEHTATFFIDDDDVGSIPVFIESGEGGDPRVAAEETFSKALQKGAVVWLHVPAGDAKGAKEHSQAVWYVLEGGKVYVFDGPTEQQVPGLTDAAEVQLTARSKDMRHKVSHVPATVRLVPADDPLFTRIGQAGLGRRLNLPDGEGALDRWRRNCRLVELTPRFADEPAGAA